MAGVNAVLASGDVKLDIEMPDTANVSVPSVQQQVGPDGGPAVHRLEHHQQLQIVRSTGWILSTTPENFATRGGSVGANYRLRCLDMARQGCL
jgi:hypothetical protein